MADQRADDRTERLTRWLAGRSTRRSFLGRLGRAAVFVASGPTIATLLVADEAEARVCGQSGVAPKCPTFDCDDGVWGWCWYATGCCAGGGLKKICDCCADIDYVHGYCPSGTNVLCIVESCNADPRVQVVALDRVPTDDAVAASAGAARARHAPGEAPVVWLIPADRTDHAGVLASLAARAGATLLLTDRTALAAPTVAALQRLASTQAVVFDGTDSLVVDLERYGLSVEQRSVPDDAAEWSVEVAHELLAAGADRALCIEPVGVSGAARVIAAGAAAEMGCPLVIGTARASQLATRADGPRPVITYMIGPEAAARAGEVAGGQPLRSGTLPSLSAEVLDLVVRVEHNQAARMALVPEGGVHGAAGLAMGGPVLVHEPGSIASLHDILLVTRGGFRSIAVLGHSGALSADAYYRLQSVINEFDAHLLIGVGGEGLPVIEQPPSERPVGQARRAGAGGMERSSYWTGRAADLGGG